jgi:hypothetical protein
MFTGGSQPWVRGPHAGQRLPHRTDGTFHCARFDGFTTGCNSSGAVPMSEDEEEVNGIGRAVGESGVDNQVMAELGPEAPRIVIGGGARRINSVSARELRSAEITEEIISGCGVSKCQGCFWGYVELK